jgi:hypothetical protein
LEEQREIFAIPASVVKQGTHSGLWDHGLLCKRHVITVKVRSDGSLDKSPPSCSGLSRPKTEISNVQLSGSSIYS